ncbi:MAG: hypothetical protein WA981_03660 [Glaciecola sp.]
MTKQLPVQEAIDKFLADNQNLAGSRDGFPALALNLNRVRELAEYVGELHEQVERSKAKKKELISLIYHASYSIFENGADIPDGARKVVDFQDVLEIIKE